MSDDYSETIAERTHEGTRYRARVHLDLHSADMKPDGDYFGYVFWVDGRITELLGKAYSSPDADFGLHHLWAEYRDWPEILEVLKGERDTCNDCRETVLFRDGKWVNEAGAAECPDSEADEGEDPLHYPSEDYVDSDVVDLDYISRGDHDIVNVVTKQDLTIWGWNDDKGERVHTPTHDDGTPYTPCENNLKEWEAWADGNVYLFTVEKAVNWTTSDPAHEDDMVTWDEVEAVHGYYGEEYAKEAALESLDTYAPDPEKQEV